MRLIDADVENGKLLDFIAQNDTAIGYAIEHKDMTMLEGIFAEYFEAQEIAYATDKVVEQLENVRDGYITAQIMAYSKIGSDKFISKEKTMNVAIDIVKRGGIDGNRNT